MGWLDDLWYYITTPGWKLAGLKDPLSPLGQADFPGLFPPGLDPSESEKDDSTKEGELAAKKFLYTEAAILTGIVAAPALYRYATGRSRGKRAKRDAAVAAELDNASNRAVTLLAALGPAVAFPLTYITIQKMEGAKIISKGLGDGVQGLMTAMAVAPVAGAAVNLVSKAIPGKA